MQADIPDIPVRVPEFLSLDKFAGGGIQPGEVGLDIHAARRCLLLYYSTAG